MQLAEARSLVDILAIRAHQAPSGVFFELFDETMTYGGLWDLARRYGAGLAAARPASSGATGSSSCSRRARSSSRPSSA